MGHFGQKVIGAKQYAKEAVASRPEAIFGSKVLSPIPPEKRGQKNDRRSIAGSKVTGQDPNFGGLDDALPDNHLHGLNVEDSKVALAQTDSISTLDRWHLAEHENPKHENGRKSVLKAIEERKEEITTPNPEVELQVVEEDEKE